MLTAMYLKSYLLNQSGAARPCALKEAAVPRLPRPSSAGTTPYMVIESIMVSVANKQPIGMKV